MTDYNDGRWWGWNGGECPVHPKSEVEAVYQSVSRYPFVSDTRLARDWIWDARGSNIIAFRVTKPYREPRVWWLVVDKWGDVKSGFVNCDEAKADSIYATEPEIVRVVEQAK